MKLKSLCSFTISLFLINMMPGQTPSVGTQTQPGAGYLLGPGDEIVGKVLGEPTFDFLATVNEDGKIEVPFFDKPIVAKCRTERELRSDVTDLLSKYLKSPQVSVRVTEKKSRPPVTIYGEVMNTQPIDLRRQATLLEVLAFAGGVKEEAGGVVQVYRTQSPMCSVGGKDDWKKSDPTDVSRTYSLKNVKMGNEESNPVIYPGDVIFIHKAPPVYITGEVVAPQGIYLKEGGLSLTEAIAKVSGPRREAKTKDVKIYRLKPNSTPDSKDRDVISVNYDLIRKGRQKDVMLQAYDIIEIDKAKDSIAMSILKIATGAAKAGVNALSTGGGYRVLY